MGCIDWEVKGTFDNSMIFSGPNLGRKLLFPPSFARPYGHPPLQRGHYKPSPFGLPTIFNAMIGWSSREWNWKH